VVQGSQNEALSLLTVQLIKGVATKIGLAGLIIGGGVLIIGLVLTILSSRIHE
jgi:hypothetical protein